MKSKVFEGSTIKNNYQTHNQNYSKKQQYQQACYTNPTTTMSAIPKFRVAARQSIQIEEDQPRTLSEVRDDAAYIRYRQKRARTKSGFAKQNYTTKCQIWENAIRTHNFHVGRHSFKLKRFHRTKKSTRK
jgi:hypothetical protein